jgi:hypothetical protein
MRAETIPRNFGRTCRSNSISSWQTYSMNAMNWHTALSAASPKAMVFSAFRRAILPPSVVASALPSVRGDLIGRNSKNSRAAPAASIAPAKPNQSFSSCRIVDKGPDQKGSQREKPG